MSRRPHPTLRVDRIVVETSAELAEAERIPEIVRDAFIEVTKRLRAGRLDLGDNLVAQVIEALEVGMRAPSDILGPGGASRLADAVLDAWSRDRGGRE